MSAIYVPRPSMNFLRDPFGPALVTDTRPFSAQTLVAQGVAEVVSAWRFVYQRYLASGLIAAHAYQLHTVPQAIQRGTTVITRDRGGRIQSTISCYADGEQGLPLDTVFRDELAEARSRNPRIGEIGLFAEEDVQRGSGMSTELFDFMRFPVYALYHQGVSEILIGVHPRHARFYSRLLGFEVAGPVRRYSLVRDRPVVLLRFDVAQLDATGAAPRGLRYWREHRLEADAFEQRFNFKLRDVATSILPRYLRWVQEGHAEPIRIAAWA